MNRFLIGSFSVAFVGTMLTLVEAKAIATPVVDEAGSQLLAQTTPGYPSTTPLSPTPSLTPLSPTPMAPTMESPSFSTLDTQRPLGNRPNIALLAERGYFQEQGIPGGIALVTAYQSGAISARDVVQAAIDSQRISAERMDDLSYITAVANQLRTLSDNGTQGNN